MDAKKLTKQVFLSHARREQDLADAIAKNLSERGIKVWDDQKLPAAADWGQEVAKALEQSDAMIALLTPHSFSSSWVRSELEHAFFDDRYKHRLLPVLIGAKSEEFARLPWILTRLALLRIPEAEPTKAHAERVAEAFVDLLKQSKAEK